jgi:hypothetical protein
MKHLFNPGILNMQPFEKFGRYTFTGKKDEVGFEV